jgi:hypothetical protein
MALVTRCSLSCNSSRCSLSSCLGVSPLALAHSNFVSRLCSSFLLSQCKIAEIHIYLNTTLKPLALILQKEGIHYHVYYDLNCLGDSSGATGYNSIHFIIHHGSDVLDPESISIMHRNKSICMLLT